MDHHDYLEALVEDPTKVFSVEVKESGFFDRLVKQFVDPITQHSKLDEIYIDGLDASQIFGQSKIAVENAGQVVLERLDEFQGSDVDSEAPSESEEGEPEEVGELEEPEEDSEELEEQEFEEFEEAEEAANSEEGEEAEAEEEIHINKDAFGLNDGFFDIDEFNKQILAMENDNDDDDEDIDYFAAADDDDEIDYYDDFFDKPNASKPLDKKPLMESSDEEEEEDLDENAYNDAIGEMRQDLYEEKSSFEKQQESLQKQISELEDELVAEKKWTMKGEVKSNQRPEDSLLNDQEDFDFDRVSKAVPIITEEMTDSIEDIIRNRIKNDQFDDLPKRFLNQVVKPRRERTEVSETKSSKSLAEIYEDEYKGVETNEKEEKLTQDHQEIKELYNKVNYTLDALTSFHFVPKPHEAKVIEVKNSTIEMEDAQPEFVSNESRLAPQEVFKKDDKTADEISLKSGLSYARDELSRDEKQRLRRANKRKKAKKFQQNKKQKPDSVMDTLSSNKNLTIIGKSGEKTDIKGNVKKQKEVKSNTLKL